MERICLQFIESTKVVKIGRNCSVDKVTIKSSVKEQRIAAMKLPLEKRKEMFCYGWMVIKKRVGKIICYSQNLKSINKCQGVWNLAS